MTPYLSPIPRPRGLVMKAVYAFSRRQFGKVPTPFTVFVARMPLAFGSFYGKVSSLDRKLKLPSRIRNPVREPDHYPQIRIATSCLHKYHILSKNSVVETPNL